MDPGVAERINELRKDDTVVPPHAGLSLADALSQIPKGDVETLIEVMRAAVEQYNVHLGDEVHEALLAAPEIVEVLDMQSRQLYFHELFRVCIDGSTSST